MSERSDQARILVNSEAERALLGKVIADDRQWWDISDRLTASDFGHFRHDLIFDSIARLMSEARRVTVSSVLAQMGEASVIDKVSAAGYLHGLVAEATSATVISAPIKEYADIILHRSGCRKLVETADKIKADAIASSLSDSIEDIRQSASKALANWELPGATDDRSIGELMQEVVQDTDAAKKAGRRVGLKIGIGPIDELVGTLFDGNLFILAGETGSGKTALAVQIGIALAEQGIPGRMSSLEMTDKEIARRYLASRSAVTAERIADADVSEAELDRMTKVVEESVDLPFKIDGSPKATVGTIQARLARAKARYGIKFAIIDHLQYIKSDLARGEEREKIAQVVDDIKAMAKRLGILVILISHISRQVDWSKVSTASDIRRPGLSNLYGSSAIEKAADVVLFVHRPHWFLERATPTAKKKGEYEADLLLWEGKAELVLPKRRSGAGYGTRKVYFNGPLTWFSEEPLSYLKDEQLEMIG